jgi:hypothetical protein
MAEQDTHNREDEQHPSGEGARPEPLDSNEGADQRVEVLQPDGSKAPRAPAPTDRTGFSQRQRAHQRGEEEGAGAGPLEDPLDPLSADERET